MTILIVDDEEPIRDMVGLALTRAGFTMVEAEDGDQAQKIIEKESPDLILMDWMLPDVSGVHLTRRLRRNRSTGHIPIIMLTARSAESDKISGLNSGADDYVSKPFSPGELIARIQAVLRRFPKNKNENVLKVNQLSLDVAGHRVSIDGKRLHLGPTEFRLLQFFLQHPERVYSREQLLDYVWPSNVYVEDRTVDVHILRLRKALAAWGYDRYIQTVRGSGYRFSEG